MEAILNSQNQKLNTLGTLQSSYFGPYQALGQNLLQLAGQTGISQEQLYKQLYESTLPYLTQVNYPKQSGLAGLISGGIQGAQGGAAFGPVGMIAGGLAGGATGYYGSKSDAYSQPYMLSDYYKGGRGGGGLDLQSLMALANGGRAF